MHQFHLEDQEMECTECHRRPANLAPGRELVFSERPDHTACEDCHDEVNDPETPEGPVCRVCHAEGDTSVGIFPSGGNTLMQFSHVMHVDPKGRRDRQGLRLDCAVCHVADATQRVPPRPGHAQCSVCHADAETAAPIIAAEGGSEACATCHLMPKIDAILAKRIPGATPSPQASPRAAGDQVTAAALVEATGWVTATGGPYRDIVPFPHHRHVQRRDGKPIDCATCHSAVLQRQAFGRHEAVPSMQQCASCHDQASWVRPAYLTKQCQVCHTTIRADIRPLASHPVSQNLVHHAGFARSHDQQARAPDSLCSTCHRGFVNVAVDQCAGCHSSMRPRSHQPLRFADLGHGRQAAFDRQSCGTCHTASFCVSCHSVPPRSHTPLPFFRSGGHRQLASMNPRSCLVCHQFEPDCQECHNRQLRR
jgi:hypothetical protein